MNPYHQEQSEAIRMAARFFDTIPASRRSEIFHLCEEYMAFRREVDRFLADHFSRVCDEKCFQSRTSACCSKEGIITFFADTAINVLHSTPAEVDRLLERLKLPDNGFKCIYLAENGCLWRVPPSVCRMFLCDPAQKAVFGDRPDLREKWEDFRAVEKTFRWPDRPVLFDRLERLFIDAGLSSPLMYLHNSPGLLRVKQRAGLCTDSPLKPARRKAR